MSPAPRHAHDHQHDCHHDHAHDHVEMSDRPRRLRRTEALRRMARETRLQRAERKAEGVHTPQLTGKYAKV